MKPRSILCCVLVAAAGWTSCKRQVPTPTQEKAPGQAAVTPEPKKKRWWSAPTPTPTPVPDIWTHFSGEKAMAHVQALVDLGPRPSGSAKIEESRAYITKQLESLGWRVERQRFTEQTPRGPIEFVNLVARFGEAKGQQVIIASHYDTKVYDTITFVGANDAGSSTGALVELARVLSLDPLLARRVELVFFDGEEAIQQFSETDGLYGSRHYAADLKATGRAGQFQAGILWDMIGETDLTITLSPDSPPKLTAAILASAETLGLRDHFSYHSRVIWDDHVPINRIGIPMVDLIDFEFPAWHTADDTLDKLSPESMRKIGAITLHYLRHSLPAQ